MLQLLGLVVSSNLLLSWKIGEFMTVLAGVDGVNALNGDAEIDVVRAGEGLVIPSVISLSQEREDGV